MDWVKEILTILGSIVTVFGLLSVPKLFADLSFIRKIDYDEWEKFKQREKEFDENTKLFEKEALLKTVGFLKNFTWKEYFALSQCDIGLKDIKSINILKRTENIEFDGLIFLISKEYLNNYFINLIDFIKFLFSFLYFLLLIILGINILVNGELNFNNKLYMQIIIFSIIAFIFTFLFVIRSLREIFCYFYIKNRLKVDEQLNAILKIKV